MKSLALALILYPLLLPVWEKEPFSAKNIRIPDAPSYLPLVDIDEQRFFYLQSKDPRLRAKIIRTMSQANSPIAVKMLGEFLTKEKNELVIADILFSLYKQRYIAQLNDSEKFKKLFKSHNATIRAYASALYLQKTGDEKTIFRVMINENSRFVLNLLWSQLEEDRYKCITKFLKPFFKSDKDINKASSIYLLALKRKDPDKYPELKEAVKSKCAFVRIKLAQGLKKRIKGGENLLLLLSDDENCIVREIVASTSPVGSLREKIHLKLSRDKDWEVRRLASISLRNYKTDQAISALLERISDKYKPVRTAAEDSLIFINPDNKVKDSLGEKYLKASSSRSAAIKIIGDLKVIKFSKEIHSLLKKESNPELIIRSVLALGLLDYKESAKTIESFHKNKNPEIRRAVAEALRHLKVPDTYDSIISLSNDKDRTVSYEAIKTMGIIGDKYFNRTLFKHARNVRTHALTRSSACWSIAKVNAPDKSIISWLDSLCSKKVIPVEGMTMYDADFVRAASCWALVEMGKTDPESKETALNKIRQLNNPFAEAGFSGPTLREYYRQAYLYMQGIKAEPYPVPETKPYRSITKLE